MSNRYAGLQNLGDSWDISTECENTSQGHTRLPQNEAEQDVASQRMLKTFR